MPKTKTSKAVIVPKSSDWYKALLEDISATITEKKTDASWTILEMYHEVGSLIKAASKDVPITKLVKEVSVDMNLCERNLWYAVQFSDKYPDMESLPEGKSITWTKVKALLPVNSVLSKPIPKGSEDIARALFYKYGPEKTKEIVGFLNELLQEHADNFEEGSK